MERDERNELRKEIRQTENDIMELLAKFTDNTGLRVLSVNIDSAATLRGDTFYSCKLYFG
jgi:hypothetical protein